MRVELFSVSRCSNSRVAREPRPRPRRPAYEAVSARNSESISAVRSAGGGQVGGKGSGGGKSETFGPNPSRGPTIMTRKGDHRQDKALCVIFEATRPSARPDLSYA